MSTRSWNMRSFRCGVMGSISAWLPSRRSTAHQRGAFVITALGQVRSGRSMGVKGWYRGGRAWLTAFERWPSRIRLLMSRRAPRSKWGPGAGHAQPPRRGGRKLGLAAAAKEQENERMSGVYQRVWGTSRTVGLGMQRASRQLLGRQLLGRQQLSRLLHHGARTKPCSDSR